MTLRDCIAALALATLDPSALRRLAALTALAMFAPMAPAFPPSPPLPFPESVVEYFNTGTGHYFYTWRHSDQQALASGAFGSGWIKTGVTFAAWSNPELARYPGAPGWPAFDSCAAPRACMPIVRFYAPGPNSHFFTGSASDIAILDRPGTGWLRENVAFYTGMPDERGVCASGTVPMRRLYNNRASQNDTNHRYVAEGPNHPRMLAKGWIDEGVAFCTSAQGIATVETHSLASADSTEILDIRDCRAKAAPGNCVGMMNLPVPSFPFPTASIRATRDDFDLQTGLFLDNPALVNLAVRGGSPVTAAQDAFVQLVPPGSQEGLHLIGLHLATQSRTTGPYSSITALRRLPRATVIPYFDTGTERELSLSAEVFVKQATAPAGSHAYGVFTLQFTDESSSRSLLFHILAFGTAPAGEGVVRDVHTSLPLVYTTVGPAGEFGRFGWFAGSPPAAIFVPGGTSPQRYYARIGRRHFLAILEAARQIDPQLSPRPEDYSLANFGLVNEAHGEGRIGLVLSGVVVSIQGEY